MANYYRTREGAVADDDVKTQLTTLGSQTAPGPLLVPGDASHLRAIHVAAVSSNESAGQSAYIVRLEGPGIQRGTFIIAAGADGGSVATGGGALISSTRLPVNITVTPSQEVTVFAEALGVDEGTYQIAVTLEFGTEAGPEGEMKGEITVEGDITAVDTLTRFTTQGSITAPSRLTPPDATMLKRVIYALASDNAADGEVTYLLRLSGDAIKGGEQVIAIGGASYIDVQAGSDSSRGIMAPTTIENLDLEIAPNETLDISMEMTGVDGGTTTAVVTAIFA